MTRIEEIEECAKAAIDAEHKVGMAMSVDSHSVANQDNTRAYFKHCHTSDPQTILKLTALVKAQQAVIDRAIPFIGYSASVDDIKAETYEALRLYKEFQNAE